MDKRIGAVARAVGYRATCEACEASAELQRRSDELCRALGIPDTPAAPRLQMRASCCGRSVTVAAHGFTPREVADFARWEEIYEAGEMCRPEFVRLNESLRATLDRAKAEQYGVHVAEFDALYSEYRERVEGFSQAPLPYLCRVPECGCQYPKTLEEWRANVRAHGLTGAG